MIMISLCRMDNAIILDYIREQLWNNIDEETKKSAQRYFKEQITSHGVKTSIVTKISKESYRMMNGFEKKKIFSVAEELLQSGYIEESFISFKWAEYLSKDFEKHDFDILERWLSEYVTNWASCDTLCNHAIGTIVEMFPEYLPRLKQWTSSDNRWVRRGAATTLILPARKGLFLKEVLEIATLLLKDTDDLVQKGYGWMLKETSKTHQQEVFDFIMKHKKSMPRTALRYAIEKMPKELRKRAMQR